MKIYKSKIDLWLIIVLVAPLIYVIIQCYLDKEYEPLFILVPIWIAVGWALSTIKYSIEDNELRVIAIFCRQSVAINSIKSVQKTYNPLSAPALSINRLEIKYGDKFDYLLISPNNREQFIADLLEKNPDIQVKL